MHYPQHHHDFLLGKAARKNIEKLHDPNILMRLSRVIRDSHLRGRSPGKPLRSERERRLRSVRIGSYRAILEPRPGGDTIVAFGTRGDIYRML